MWAVVGARCPWLAAATCARGIALQKAPCPPPSLNPLAHSTESPTHSHQVRPERGGGAGQRGVRACPQHGAPDEAAAGGGHSQPCCGGPCAAWALSLAPNGSPPTVCKNHTQLCASSLALPPLLAFLRASPLSCVTTHVWLASLLHPSLFCAGGGSHDGGCALWHCDRGQRDRALQVREGWVGRWVGGRGGGGRAGCVGTMDRNPEKLARALAMRSHSWGPGGARAGGLGCRRGAATCLGSWQP